MKIGDKVKIFNDYNDDYIGKNGEVVSISSGVDDTYPIGVILNTIQSGIVTRYYQVSDLKIINESENEPKPDHYKTESIDVIDFCKLYNLNFNRGNIIKYVSRAGKKDDELKDLKKALDYIKREMKYLETIKTK